MFLLVSLGRPFVNFMAHFSPRFSRTSGPGNEPLKVMRSVSTPLTGRRVICGVIAPVATPFARVSGISTGSLNSAPIGGSMTLPPPPPQPPPPQPPPPIAWAMSLFAPTYTPAAASEVNLMKSRLLTRLMRPASMIPSSITVALVTCRTVFPALGRFNDVASSTSSPSRCTLGATPPAKGRGAAKGDR